MKSCEQPSDEFSYLHPSSLMFDVISHGRSYLIPAIIAMFSAAKGETFGLILAGVIFVPALLSSVIRYATMRYRIVNSQLIVSKGLFTKQVRTVPVSRIQNIDLVQSVMHRFFGVAEVRVETASGTEPEAILRVLSMQQLEKLRAEIFQNQQQIDPLAPADAMPDAVVAPAVTAETLLQIPISRLIQAGLASNRGMVMIGVLLGLYYQFDLDQKFDLTQLEQFVPQGLSQPIVIALIVAASLLLLLALRIVGVVWFILRFYGYRLQRQGDDLRISCGLFTRISATIPRKRIQLVSVHQNWIMRWAHLSAIRIETAGGAGSSREDATTTVSKRWFIPVIPTAEVESVLNELRSGTVWSSIGSESGPSAQPLASRATQRQIRIASVVSIAIAIIGWFLSQPWGWLAGVVALPLLIARAILKCRSMKYYRSEDQIIFCSGIFTLKTSIIFLDRIQALRVDQTLFDRRWKMAQFSIDTAAAGPADHRIDIPWFDQQFADSELQAVRELTASVQPDFG